MRNSATEPSQCLLCNEAEYMLCFNCTSRREGNAGSMTLLIGVAHITDLAVVLLIDFIKEHTLLWTICGTTEFLGRRSIFCEYQAGLSALPLIQSLQIR